MLRGIRLGELDQKWTVEESTSTLHAITNDPVESWTTLKTIWLKELNPQSKEQFEANQQVAHTVSRLMGRYDSAITEIMRLVSPDGDTFYISGIQKKRREGYIILTVEKRDNG